MEKALLIYPHDDSTSFLLNSFHLLQHRLETLLCYEILPNDDSHDKCLSLIGRYENIIFMGHGSHVFLSGAKTASYFRQHFLDYRSINDLGQKNWLFFSCNSCELIKRCPNINAIGFGNLPTSFEEIQGAREFEVNAYEGATMDTIRHFQESINWIIQESVIAFLNSDLTIRDIYNRCNILITKRIIDLNPPSDFEQRALINLLFDMKSELNFVKQKV